MPLVKLSRANITGFWLTALLLLATPALAAPFTNNGDGTLTDQATGLTWQQADDNQTRTGQAALDYCNGLTLAGSSDWRLPTIQELRTIVDVSRFEPAIDPVFTGTKSSNYWSSSVAGSPYQAWYVYFPSGSVTYSSKSSSYYVRCVR